jgi:fructokinase
MADQKFVVVGLGELLWDVFPSGKQLGGAPSNFAYITNLLGDKGIPASRVGNDALGEEAGKRLGELSVSAEFAQIDSDHPTGTVKVEVDPRGQPRFEITQNVAWDFLEWSNSWQQLATRTDAVCFGSLAQRSSQSRSTIRKFLGALRRDAVSVFDVNLRQKFYDSEILSESMRLASILKLNHEELPVIKRLAARHHGEDEERGELKWAEALLQKFGLRMICVTRGANGSVLITREERHEHSGFKVKIADTVGAGDAFTAAMLHEVLRGAPLAQINETANRVGAWVASQHGGMPAAPGGLWQNVDAIVSTSPHRS